MIDQPTLINALNATQWVQTENGIKSVGGRMINGGNIGDVSNIFDVFSQNLGVSPTLLFPQSDNEGHSFEFVHSVLPRLAKLGMIFPGSDEEKLKDDTLCGNDSVSKETGLEVLRFYEKQIRYADLKNLLSNSFTAKNQQPQGFTSKNERDLLLHSVLSIGDKLHDEDAYRWNAPEVAVANKRKDLEQQHRAEQLIQDSGGAKNTLLKETAQKLLKIYERNITYDSARKKIHVKGLTGPTEYTLLEACMRSLGAEIAQPVTGNALATATGFTIGDDTQQIAKQLVEAHINFKGRADVRMPHIE